MPDDGMPDDMDAIEDAMAELTDAVSRLGFDAAKDVLMAWQDACNDDADQPVWLAPFVDGVHYALSVAAAASRADDAGDPRFLSVSDEPGRALTWEWRGTPDPEFADWVLRAVAHALRANGARPEPDRSPIGDGSFYQEKDIDALMASRDALRLALPVMRRTLWEYLESVMVHSEPMSTAPAEWEEVMADVRAVRAAEAAVGPQPDQPGVSTAALDDILARSTSWISDAPGEDPPV